MKFFFDTSALVKFFYTESGSEFVTQMVIDEAGLLLKKYGKEYGLRNLDALHLGTYSLIYEQGWCFVTSDTVLADVAKLAGFLLLNPQKVTDMDLNIWITAHE